MPTPDLMINDKPRCPRCGYDQRGVVSTWTDRCPLEGICTECGLEFEWAKLLVSHKFEPVWFVESATGKRNLLCKCIQTCIACGRPWRFFRDLELTHRLSIGQQARYVLVLICSVVIAYSIALGSSIFRQWMFASGSASLVKSIVWGLLFPWKSPPGGMIGGPTSGSYIGAPEVLWQFVDRLDRTVVLEIAVVALIFTMISVCLFPVLFLVIPTSRKQARVKWGHIERVFFYSLTHLSWFVLIALILFLAGWTPYIPGFFTSTNRSHYAWTAACVVSAASLPSILLWWGFALNRYLHIRHAWFVAVMFWILCLLLTPFVFGGALEFLEWINSKLG